MTNATHFTSEKVRVLWIRILSALEAAGGTMPAYEVQKHYETPGDGARLGILTRFKHITWDNNYTTPRMQKLVLTESGRALLKELRGAPKR